MLLVLRTGDAVPEVAASRGNFLRWFQETVGDAWDRDWREHDARSEEELPDPAGFAGIMVTGSASSVTERAPWMLRAEAFLRAAVAADVPVLGICFGHQLLAQALGGHVARNPQGREIGTVKLEATEHAGADPLFEGLPPSFAVNASHVDTVERLPPGATVLSCTGLERHASFRVGRAWGVQFHPEFDGDVMRQYAIARRPAIESEGLPWEHIHGSAQDAPHAVALMKNFVHRVVKRHR